MEETTIFELVICFGILCLVLVYPWVRRVASVGLPMCYILSLTLIHWLGALIHALPLPWHSSADPYTELGFRQAFWATLAFAIGAMILAPLVLKLASQHETSAVVRNPTAEQSRLPLLYILLGIVFFGVLAPVLKSVPSISAVTVSGVYLAVVGVCLACWNSYHQRKYKKLVFCLLAVCVLPFITIVALGFVGYGAVAALLVFTFVASYYRPRWQAIVGLGLLIFFGLSLYVTYFRDRRTIRQKVWGGADLTDRIDTLTATLSNFEFIDLENPRHLASIDERLNQNYLVGRVIRTIDSGQADFANGGTLYEAVLAIVPRILWPEKPVVAGSGNTVSRYTRLTFEASTSVGIGQVMEFYINFVTLGDRKSVV